MEAQTTQAVGLVPTWLNPVGDYPYGATNSPGYVSPPTCTCIGACCCIPSWGFNLVTTYPPASPKVRLTLTEVMHLREVAMQDHRLRATLEKFTPHIEVEVDFPAEGSGKI